MITESYQFSEKSTSILTNASNFYIDNKSREIAILYRVLSGTCLITNLNHEIPVDLSSNYFFENFTPNDKGDLSFLDTFEESINLDDYDRFIEKSGYKNHKFYRAFLNEIASSVYYEETERHTAAFVHIYRAYEHMSYAFPMIYASKTDDYIATFQNLRTWLTRTDDGNTGELKFHKSFIATLFKGLPELSNTVDIHILARNEFRDKIFSVLANKVVGWKSPDKYTPTTVRPDKLAIQFLEFHSFIVTLRNRYFHYSNTRSDNIGLDEIVESDMLFSFVNKPALNYIATIFNAIIRHQMG